MDTFIHPLADCQSTLIGEGTRIWQFCVIMREAIIERNCNICANVVIEGNVLIGDNVTIKSGVQIWDGAVIEDNVFIGPNATYTNDRFPVSGNRSYECKPLLLQRNCVIGANATILPGVVVGEHAFVAAGSVVTHDVMSSTMMMGTPSKFVRNLEPGDVKLRQ